VAWPGLRIGRWEGVVFIAAYVTYVAYLVLTATDHEAAGIVAPTSLVVAPLVMVTFGVLGFQGWRQHRDRERVALDTTEP
jgi:cation:H+ antiporter